MNSRSKRNKLAITHLESVMLSALEETGPVEIRNHYVEVQNVAAQESSATPVKAYVHALNRLESLGLIKLVRCQLNEYGQPIWRETVSLGSDLLEARLREELRGPWWPRNTSVELEIELT